MKTKNGELAYRARVHIILYYYNKLCTRRSTLTIPGQYSYSIIIIIKKWLAIRPCGTGTKSKKKSRMSRTVPGQLATMNYYAEYDLRRDCVLLYASTSRLY